MQKALKKQGFASCFGFTRFVWNQARFHTKNDKFGGLTCTIMKVNHREDACQIAILSGIIRANRRYISSAIRVSGRKTRIIKIMRKQDERDAENRPVRHMAV